jgi:hypothetical protein
MIVREREKLTPTKNQWGIKEVAPFTEWCNSLLHKTSFLASSIFFIADFYR